MRQLIMTVALLCNATVMLPAIAADTNSQQVFELSHAAFINNAFAEPSPDDSTPAPQRLWIRGELKTQIEKILQHRARFLRTKYWLNENRSVWIIDEIGKEKSITSGIIVSHENGLSEIIEVKVLAFREPRGWEIKHSFFTDQFKGVRRLANGKRGLTPTINGITGATLSVRALKKVAEIALLLDEHVRTQEAFK